ncbi:unnamed protein product, partial [Staurois parvus]
IYPWAGTVGNRRQSTPGQGPRATGGNLPLGRDLGQQVAIYPWARTSSNRRQSTPGQGSRATGDNLPLGRGPRGLNGTLAVESGLSTAPTQLSRDIGFTGTQRVAMAQALRGTTGSYTPGML